MYCLSDNKMLSKNTAFVLLVCGAALAIIMASELSFSLMLGKANYIRWSLVSETVSARLLSRRSYTMGKGNFTVGYTTNNKAAVKMYDYLPVEETEEDKERRSEQIRTWLGDFPKRKPEVIPKCKNVTKKILWFDIWHDGWGVRNWCRKIDLTQCCCRCEIDFFLFNDTNKLYDPICGDAILFEINRLKVLGHPPIKHNGQVFVGVEKEPVTSKTIPLQNFEYVFNWTMTYRRDSDIFYPYGRIKKRTKKLPVKNYTDIYRKKKKGIIWFVSHCNTSSRREDYAKELSKYIDIDIIGKCGSDICRKHGTCTEQLEEEYFFRFNLENSYRRDYVTEKLFENFSKDMIQIVGGAADYDNLAPPNTVIDISKFDSPAHLADYLKSLMKSEKHYTRYLKTKDRYQVDLFIDEAQRAYCELCSMLHDPDRYGNLYYYIGSFFDHHNESLQKTVFDHN